MDSLDIEFIHPDCAKSAVLLFHGLTGSPFELKKYAKILYGHGFDVYCPTLPGHMGHRIDIYNVKFEDWINFACEKYRCLRGYYTNFYTGGLCLGALLGLYLGENYKSITGLICLCATLYLDGTNIPKYNFLLPLGLNTIIKHYYTFAEKEPYGIKNKITRKKISKLMHKNTVALDNYPLSAIGELLKTSKAVRKNISNITNPILIVHSIEDDFTGIKSADFIYNNVSSKTKEKIVLNNSYHLILYDNEKEYVYAKTLDFLFGLENEKTFSAALTSRKNKEVLFK